MGLVEIGKQYGIAILTPKNTEEVKPGLFIQKQPYGMKGYRQIHPPAWNGKINWNNFIFGGKPVKMLVWLAIILFIAFAYWNDVREYKDFYQKVLNDPLAFCEDVKYAQNVECTPEAAEKGLCVMDAFGVINESMYTIPSDG